MSQSYHATQLSLFVLEKQCRKCPQNGLQDINNFPKDKNSKDGHYSYCKACSNARVKKYYQENRESKLEYAKEHHELNKERIKEYRKGYNKINSKKRVEYQKEYERLNKEVVLEKKREYRKRTAVHRYQYNKEYVETHKQEVKQRLQAHYLANRARILQRVANYRINNLEKVRETKRIYHAKNRDKVLVRRQKRRGRRRAGGSFSAQEWRNLKVLCNHACLCCGKSEPEIKLTLDHVIPLSRGGSNTIDNIQPLCLTCNLKKGTKSTDYR